MFFYPDPDPIGHRITEVRQSYLTEGVLLNGRIGPTHKLVGKQLSPIPRGPDDPVAPRAEVSSRTLDRWVDNSRAWYVDECGRNAKALYSMMGLLPKEKVDLYAGWKSKVAPFPRSEQYEYRYIKDMRLKNAENQEKESNEEKFTTKPEKDHSAQTTAAFQYTTTPIWWQSEIPKRVNCTVGNPDDYQFQRLSDLPEKLTEQKQKNSEEEGMRESLDVDKNDAVMTRTIVDEDKSLAEEADNENKQQETDEVFAVSKRADLLLQQRKKQGEEKKLDPRWHAWHDVCDVPKSDADRKKAMLNLHRPYRHEINTWYSKNKPTKLLPPMISEGKRPILEWHFSNL